MNQVQELVEYIQSIFPESHVSVDSPEKTVGSSWVDIRLKDRTVVVEFRPTQGFGVSIISDNDDLGSLFGGPEKVFPSLDDTKSYIRQLLETQGL